MSAETSFGAFVEIDHARVSREEVYLMGAMEGVGRWIDKLRSLSDDQPHAGVAQVMREIADQMNIDRDGIAVALTRVATRTGSGKLEHIRKD